MLIYGNTPRDIMAMIWRRRYRFVSVFAVIVIAVMLTGCGTAKDKKIELKALDQFWERLATGKNSTGVE
jgi:hypothetical protein